MDSIEKKIIMEFGENGCITRLSMDSEDGARLSENLLVRPSRLICGGNADANTLALSCEKNNDSIVLTIENKSGKTLAGVGLVLSFDPLFTATVLFPTAMDKELKLLPPWMLLSPDYGYALITPNPVNSWTAEIIGRRGDVQDNAPVGGVDPTIKGDDWIKAAQVRDFVRGELNLSFVYNDSLDDGEKLSLVFTVPELKKPQGIDDDTWKTIRRAYMNVWQPASSWLGKEKMVLANNVLSEPASCCLWYYSAPMHFWHEPLEGINLIPLLKHSIDFYLKYYCSPLGHIIAFGMYDMYVHCNATFLISVWDYFKLSSDVEWCKQNIKKLNNLANYLIRRDIDGDGIIESYGSGNRGTLRDPDRADVWWEMVNFNYKNSFLNVLSYRAFLCFAEILDACGLEKGALRFKEAAQKLKNRFREVFYNPKTGLIASWISLDGEVHDYAYTPINAMAVTYGLISPEESKDIMRILLDKIKEIGFDAFHLGVPLNLIPTHPLDRIQPTILPDGSINEAWLFDCGEDGSKDFGKKVYNGSIAPVQTWQFILGLQRAGFSDEADKIINAMSETAYKGNFQNGIVNCGYGGAEHLRWDGNTCGYEGYLSDEWVFLSSAFTRDAEQMKKLLGPVY